MTNIKIYCDLDGVLADFDKRIFELTGKWCHEQESKWIWIAAHRDDEFFCNLDLLPDAAELWDYIKHHDVRFLTSCKTKKFRDQKKRWVQRHFSDTPVEFVNASALKAHYADATAILIDDRITSIDPWREAGGIGILHTSAIDTIQQLRELHLYDR